MKILHLISQRPDSTGSGIYLQQLMREARRAGHSNFLICGVDANEVIELGGVRTDRISAVEFGTRINPGAIVGMSDVMPYQSRTFSNLSAEEITHYQHIFRRAIKSAVKRWRPDLIHSHHLWLVSSLAAEAAGGVPIVCSCHGSDLRQFGQCPHLRTQVLAGCRKLSRVLALSADQKTLIVQGYGIEPDRVDVVGAGFDHQLFNDIGRAKRLASAPSIVYAGKLSRAKGVVWLLKALQILSHYPFHLHLVGSGQGEEADHCLAEAEKLGDRLTVHGPLSQAQLGRLLQGSDLFVLPSLFEGLPLVVLEALSCGCRVITTDLPGCREILKRTGTDRLLLVPSPTVINVQRTELDDETKFVSDLIRMLTPFLMGPPSLPVKEVELRYFHWSAVYQRIENSWMEVLSTTRHC